jgi:hypothetical protein
MICCPGEGEILFPPLSHLEVVGSPHTEQHDGKPVVVLRIKVNINQKAQVIEEILSQRKQTIVAIAENVMKEVAFDVKLISDAPCSQPKLQEALKGLKRRDAEWFNADSNFKSTLENLLSLKEETVFDFVMEHYRRRDRRRDTEWLSSSFDIKDALDSLFACGLSRNQNAVPRLGNPKEADKPFSKVNTTSLSLKYTKKTVDSFSACR